METHACCCHRSAAQCFQSPATDNRLRRHSNRNQGSSLGGQVARGESDQNTILLEGSNIANGVSGNSDYYANFRGGLEGPIPTPGESIEEFKVATHNPNASFAGSAGS